MAKAEAFLQAKGLGQARVRHHGEIARIEVLPAVMPACVDGDLRAAISTYFRQLGFSYITLDLEGYRSGSLNRVLEAL